MAGLDHCQTVQTEALTSRRRQRQTLRPSRWTAPDPAMSTHPNTLRKPLSAQIQWAGKQYTNVFRNEKSIYLKQSTNVFMNRILYTNNANNNTVYYRITLLVLNPIQFASFGHCSGYNGSSSCSKGSWKMKLA